MDVKEISHSTIDFEPETAAGMRYSRAVMFKAGAIVSSLN
jgi:hypothetical protein